MFTFSIRSMAAVKRGKEIPGPSAMPDLIAGVALSEEALN